MSLRLLLAGTVSQTCFWWSWQFWGLLVRYFAKYISVAICLIFHSWLDWGYGFVRKITEVKHHFSSIISDTYYQHDLSLLLLTLITWLKHGLSDFSTIKLLSLHPHIHTVLFVRKSLCAAHTWGMRRYVTPLWGRSICINYFEFFCTGDMFPPSFIYIFIQPFICNSMDSLIFILYFVL